MKIYKLILFVLLFLGVTTTGTAKGYIKTHVYMFGVAASFNDSTVYFTDIQHVEVYLVDNRTHFLVNRDDYAYQLKNYLQNTNENRHPTCLVVFAETEKKAMKKYVKMQAKYTKTKRRYIVNGISSKLFSFSTVAPDAEQIIVNDKKLKNQANTEL